jgi:transcriptional regulator with XRE-family HTH domain
MGYGSMIAAARKKKHWTQFQLANQLGCSDGYITLLESERKLPSLEICLALSRVCELSPEEERDLLKAVDEARKERDTQKIRTRGMAMIGALQARGVKMDVEGEAEAMARAEAEPERIAREIAGDRALLEAHRNLLIAYADPQVRPGLLSTLQAFANSAKATAASGKNSFQD